MAGVIYIDNDNLIKLNTLTNQSTGSAVTGATVTVTLKDKDGTNVMGGNTWPQSMAHVSGGTYSATLEDGLSLTEGAYYYAEITADAGSDVIGFWRIPLAAVKRRG